MNKQEMKDKVKKKKKKRTTETPELKAIINFGRKKSNRWASDKFRKMSSLSSNEGEAGRK